jgi:hypothetical protein
MDDALLELAEATRRLNRSLDGLREPEVSGLSNAQSININAGGMGGWIAAWIAAVCCAAMISGGAVFVWYTNGILAKQQDQISRNQDYLNAIYVAAPSLKPKESK